MGKNEFRENNYSENHKFTTNDNGQKKPKNGKHFIKHHCQNIILEIHLLELFWRSSFYEKNFSDFELQPKFKDLLLLCNIRKTCA